MCPGISADHLCYFMYVSGGHYTVDKTTVKFKGRLAFWQYLPMTPIKWGVTFWTLCERETGYTVSYALNFQVYTGKDQHGMEHSLGYRVIMDTVVMLHRTSAQVFFDNYFTSVQLMKNLKLLGIQACGTVHANRKDLPAAIVSEGTDNNCPDMNSTITSPVCS